jgi:CBS domain-containing protein
MATLTQNKLIQPLVLHARTAAEIMTPDPKSIRQEATVAEATAFLSTSGFSAAPVIDEAGRPIGVVSRTDLLQRKSQRAVRLLGGPSSDYGRVEPGDETKVCDVMTPAVFCVRPDDSASKIVEKMIAINVRRLFVVDDDGVLVGVVSAIDVLRGFGRPFPLSRYRSAGR